MILYQFFPFIINGIYYQLIINFLMFLLFYFPLFLYFLYTTNAGIDHTLYEKLEVRQYEYQMHETKLALRASWSSMEIVAE